MLPTGSWESGNDRGELSAPWLMLLVTDVLYIHLHYLKGLSRIPVHKLTFLFAGVVAWESILEPPPVPSEDMPDSAWGHRQSFMI